MLMMLAVSATCGKQEAQPMLMMLGMAVAWGQNSVRGRGLWEKGGPADAHDAGRGCSLCGRRPF